MTTLTLHFECRDLQNGAQLYSKCIGVGMDTANREVPRVRQQMPKYWLVPSNEANGPPLILIHELGHSSGRDEGAKQIGGMFRN
jgi:hypothetical protein